MIAIGSDHVGIMLKKEIIALLEDLNLKYKDYGTYDIERTDYPVYSERVAKAIVSGECEKGLLFCGTGIGISIAANKVDGIRAAVCSDCYSAKLSREHNDTNVLALGSRVVGVDLAKHIAKVWLETSFEGGRHQTRVNQIAVLGKGESVQ